MNHISIYIPRNQNRPECATVCFSGQSRIKENKHTAALWFLPAFMWQSFHIASQFLAPDTSEVRASEVSGKL